MFCLTFKFDGGKLLSHIPACIAFGFTSFVRIYMEVQYDDDDDAVVCCNIFFCVWVLHGTRYLNVRFSYIKKKERTKTEYLNSKSFAICHNCCKEIVYGVRYGE